jgi:putative transposase
MRYRLCPTPAQEKVLLEHCAHARFVWNLGHEQRLEYRPCRGRTPNFYEQERQLTEARAENPWLAAGVAKMQQSALQDLDFAWRDFMRGIAGKPTWRKAGGKEGFRVAGLRGKAWNVRRLSGNVGEIRIPKLGWVRFRWSRDVPANAKTFRVNRDHAGRWHIAFAVAPEPIPAPGNGKAVGIDRGVRVSAALSTGEMLRVPGLSAREKARFLRLQRKLAKAKSGSNRRGKVKLALAKMHARETDRRKDWCEKTSTDIARRFDVIRVENLRIRNMTRSAKGTVGQPGRNVAAKAGLNREIAKSGWGLLVRRLEYKASGRVEKVPPAYTSQRCSACGHVAKENRESQAAFLCTACGFACNADVNAAKNIAAGHVVTARGGSRLEPVNREPRIAKQSEIPGLTREDANFGIWSSSGHASR